MKKLTNFPFIFVGLITFSTSIVVLNFQLATLLLYIVSLLRILTTKNKLVITICLACSLVIGLICVHQLQIRQKNRAFVKSNEIIKQAQLRVDVDSIKVSGDFVTFTGKIEQGRVYATYSLQTKEEQDYFQTLTTGGRFLISGELSLGQQARNFGNFDFRNYLKNNQYLGSLKVTNIHQISRNTSWDIQLIRRKILVHIEKSFPSPLNHYISSLLFGYQSKEFDESREIFQSLGLVHLFSLSGMQIGFFLLGFKKILLRIGVTNETSFWFLCIFSVLYLGLAGFSISVFRAILTKMFEQTNRRFSLRISNQSIFGLVIFISVIFRPYLFLTTSGQLSYAMAFLINFLGTACRMYPKKWQALIFSVGLSLGILPLIIWHFYEWNPFSILFGVVFVHLFKRILLPLLTYILFIRFILPLNFLNVGFLFFERILEEVGSVLGNHWTTGKPTNLGMFFLLIAVVYMIYLVEKKQMKTVVIPIFCLLLVIFFTIKRPTGVIAMVDVGQGDSIFIQTPFAKETTLIDVGGNISFMPKEKWRQKKLGSNASKTLIPFLKARGVRVVNHLYLTHADFDHYGDVLEVAKTVKIQNVYFPQKAQEKESFKKVLMFMQKNGSKLHPLRAPKKLHEGYLLSPISPVDGQNNDSLVIYRTFGNRSFLFVGDAEKEVEHEIVKQYPSLQIDILKVGHHGSKTSSSRKFIEQLQPKLALISAGVNNRFKHPSPETIELFKEKDIPILNTADYSMVYFIISPFTNKLSPPKSIKYDRIELKN
ncbi:MAG: DNA internalization-related competence protein ComEC/Rec2 [Streptococcaceae bacterium]|jgi:competence protein ComEC|nr:DNA internalization-related competence protein ComEC/Rec2 [Streptococcaceae bacterium]